MNTATVKFNENTATPMEWATEAFNLRGEITRLKTELAQIKSLRWYEVAQQQSATIAELRAALQEIADYVSGPYNNIASIKGIAKEALAKEGVR